MRIPVEITEEPTVTYRIRSIPNGGWADITLREWSGGGSFMCQSDFGEYAHVWTSIGSDTLRQFLCCLDKDYFLKKTRPKGYMVYDHELTCKEIKADILRARKDGDLTTEDARECWEDYERIKAQWCTKSHEFYHWLDDTCLLEKVYGGDYCSLCTREVYNPMCDLFWERVWPHITAYWKDNK